MLTIQPGDTMMRINSVLNHGEIMAENISIMTSLAQLIRTKNLLDARITQIMARPALIGHTGEYIASHIFNIVLEPSATKKY